MIEVEDGAVGYNALDFPRYLFPYRQRYKKGSRHRGGNRVRGTWLDQRCRRGGVEL